MKFIIGKKLDMTQVWKGDNVVGVTRVQAGPCVVVQVKNEDKDGYSAVQVGFGKRQAKNIKKPQLKHMKGLDNFRYLREFRFAQKNAKERQDEIKLKRGDEIDVSTFEIGDNIQVTGVSKGKGFQGVVKRHGFHGQNKTHGNKDQLRMPGSIGATGPAHVFKGQKMPGRMGGDRVTTNGLEVVEIDKENDILLIKGAVPGARNGLVLVSGEGELSVKSPKSKVEGKETTDSRQQTAEENVETQKPTSAEIIADKKEKKEIAEEVKDKDIEEIVVEAAEKVGGKKKSEDKK